MRTSLAIVRLYLKIGKMKTLYKKQGDTAELLYPHIIKNNN